jgi:hypothetical protein
MKKLLILLTLLVLVVSLPLSASADIIYVPKDEFYYRHSNECTYANRVGYANGPDGELTVYTSPENCLIKAVFPNMERLLISYIYTAPDGIDWGCVKLWEDDSDGWVPMPYVWTIYNGDDFEAEFKDRIQEETGDLSAFIGQEILYWEYPGCDKSHIMDLTDSSYAPGYYYTFVDDAGQKWGQIGYYCGIRNTWICLDNPSADYNTLYANHAPQQITKSEFQLDVPPDAEPETQPETEPITQPETQPETQPTTQPDTQPETQPTTQPDPQPETQLTTQPESQPVTADKVITPSGISPTTILIAAVAVALISAGLLVVLKKKKT